MEFAVVRFAILRQYRLQMQFDKRMLYFNWEILRLWENFNYPVLDMNNITLSFSLLFLETGNCNDKRTNLNMVENNVHQSTPAYGLAIRFALHSRTNRLPFVIWCEIGFEVTRYPVQHSSNSVEISNHAICCCFVTSVRKNYLVTNRTIYNKARFFYILFYVNFMIEFINMIYFLNKHIHHFKMALYSIKSYFVGMCFLF